MKQLAGKAKKSGAASRTSGSPKAASAQAGKAAAAQHGVSPRKPAKLPETAKRRGPVPADKGKGKAKASA